MPSVLSVGRIDEAGFLKGLYRKGFTIPKALAELFANCLDAGANRIHFAITRAGVRISDNGAGMNGAGLGNMFAMHRENHGGTPRRGVSGVGKSSYVLLSKQREMMVLTRTADGDYLCAVVPWDRMFDEGRYSDMITVRPMTPEERTAFTAEHPEGHGTTVVLPYHKDLAKAIQDSFPTHAESEAPALDRLGVIFGNDEFTATLKDEHKPVETMKKYNYFGLGDADYVCGRSSWRIEHYRLRMEDDPAEREKDRFILIDGPRLKEITPAGRGYAKEPQNADGANLGDYTRVGFYTVIAGLRASALPGDLFRFTDDHGTPVEPGLRNTEYISPYDVEHFGSADTNKVLKDFLPYNKLIRNGQRIGYFRTPDYAVGSDRGGAEGKLKLWSLQVELRYDPTSEQDNPQDKLIGIQENKNQYNGDGLPLALKRLAKYCRIVKGEEICEHLQERLDTHLRERASPEPAPAPVVADSEDDDGSEFSEESDSDADDDDGIADPAPVPALPGSPVLPYGLLLGAPDPRPVRTFDDLIRLIETKRNGATLLNEEWNDIYTAIMDL